MGNHVNKQLMLVICLFETKYASSLGAVGLPYLKNNN